MSDVKVPTGAELVDLGRFALNDPESAAYQNMLAGCRADLRARGCAHLKGFIKPDWIGPLVAEADRAAAFAHRSYNEVNAYFTKDDPSLPEDHPRRQFFPRTNAFVPADKFGPGTLLRAIYDWDPFASFIQDALEEDSFHRYGDPLADVIVNTVEPGGGFPWHFDTNTYTVTLAIQNGEGGGAFEYVPNLRSREAENYQDVAAILAGGRAGVEILPLEPGDLQIFRGRYSLHRVSRVEGRRSRHVGIFSYAAEPGMVGRLERTRQLYGKVLPLHEEREAALRADKLAD